MSTSTKVAAGLMALYGLISLVGGVIGYVKADSMASLIAGGGSGLVLIACAAAVARFPMIALIVGALASLALVGRFGPVLVKSLSDGSQPVGAVPIVMTVGGVIVLIAVVVALGKRGVFKGGS